MQISLGRMNMSDTLSSFRAAAKSSITFLTSCTASLQFYKETAELCQQSKRCKQETGPKEHSNRLLVFLVSQGFSRNTDATSRSYRGWEVWCCTYGKSPFSSAYDTGIQRILLPHDTTQRPAEYIHCSHIPIKTTSALWQVNLSSYSTGLVVRWTPSKHGGR